MISSTLPKYWVHNLNPNHHCRLIHHPLFPKRHRNWRIELPVRSLVSNSANPRDCSALACKDGQISCYFVCAFRYASGGFVRCPAAQSDREWQTYAFHSTACEHDTRQSNNSGGKTQNQLCRPRPKVLATAFRQSRHGHIWRKQSIFDYPLRWACASARDEAR